MFVYLPGLLMGAEDRVRLAAARLPVGKERLVDAAEDALQERGALSLLIPIIQMYTTCIYTYNV